jgi:hypothetical protein
LLLIPAMIASSLFYDFRSPEGSLGVNRNSPLANSEENRGIQIQTMDEQHAILELTAPPFTFNSLSINGVACQVLSAPGYTSSGKPGWPELPVKGSLLGIPASAQPNLQVLEKDTITLPGRFHLCPASQPVILMDSYGRPDFQGETRSRNIQVYGSNQFIPPDLVQIDSTAFIRSQRVAQIRFQPYQYNPTTGEIQFTRWLRVAITFFPRGASLPSSPGSFIPEGRYEVVLRQILLNYEQAQAWRSQPVRAAASSPGNLRQDARPEYKILVDQDGIYELSYTDLKNAGVPVDSLDPRTLQLFNQGIEVAISVDGEQDGKFDPTDVLLFYGQKINTKFTETNVYWLGWGEGDGLRMSSLDGTPSGASVPSSFRTTLRIEQDKNYQRGDPSGPDQDHWYWDMVFASAGSEYKDFTFQLTNLASGSSTVTLRGLLKGYSATPYHHTIIYLNGQKVDEGLSWPSRSEYTFNVDLSQAFLLEGLNTIRVECPRDGEITQDIVLVNRFELDYSRAFFASSDQLFFDYDQPGTWKFQVDGFSSSNVEIYDITSPLTPKQIIGATLQSTVNGFLAGFERPISAKQRFLALDTSRRLKPISILLDGPSDLKSVSNSADYLILSHASFLSALQPLVAWRSSQGLRVQVVDVQDIYDEFNGGVFSPQAIRDFIAYAYANWVRPAPSYVLLVGDGNYDFKDNFGWGEPNYIPPYLADADPWVGETAVDNRFVTVSGNDDLPDLYLGRFPVKTPAEVQAMVANILANEQNPPPRGLNGQLTFVADNADDAGDFAAFSDTVISREISPAYTVEKIYYQVTQPTISGMKSAILQALNQGRLVVHYDGHASVQTWGAEGFLAVSDLSSLSQSAILPFLVSITCTDGYFINPKPPNGDYSSLAESLVRLPGKGAIASFAPTGFGSSAGHNILDQSLLQAIFGTSQEQIGVATTQAKINLYVQAPSEEYLVDTYVLLGDPALQLQKLPQMIYLPFLQQ